MASILVGILSSSTRRLRKLSKTVAHLAADARSSATGILRQRGISLPGNRAETDDQPVAVQSLVAAQPVHAKGGRTLVSPPSVGTGALGIPAMELGARPDRQEPVGEGRRTAVINFVAVWSAIYAVPAVFITTINLTMYAKIIWLTGITIPITCITWYLHTMPEVRRTRGGTRRRLLRAAVLLVAAGSLVLVPYAANTVQARIEPGSYLGCVAVGSGNPQFAVAFQKAYADAGGYGQLGCPRTILVPWQNGWYQILQGPHGGSAIMAINPDRAYVLDPDEYQHGFLEIADFGVNWELAGYPTGDKIRVRDGWQRVLINKDGEESALVKRDDESWHWVSPDLWHYYSAKLGGPDGKFGYPTSEQGPTGSGVAQAFEKGWLFHSAETGVLTQYQYQLYLAGKLHPTPAGAGKTSPTAGSALRVAPVYDVNAQGSAISRRFAPRDQADQKFRPTLPLLDQVGVIAGLDPINQHSADHALLIQVLGPDGRVLGGNLAPLVNNGTTSVKLPDISVKANEIYKIRVINFSTDVLGIYVNEPDRPGSVSSNVGSASINGVPDRDGWALSAYVEGRNMS